MDIEKILKELTLEEKAAICAGENFWNTKAIERMDIPHMMMCDGPHGLRKQLGDSDHLGLNESIKTVCFPTAAGLASSFDRDLLAQLGEMLGNECQSENIGMLLGPGMNIKRSPLCGRNFEYFSEDPYLTGELASSYVTALQRKGVSACPKHFAANNQEYMRMNVDTIVEERTLHEIYLAGFETMVKKARPNAMMCAYNQVNGTFASENKTLLTDILRERWGFDGCVVTDWGAVKDRVKGVKAGLDLEMPGPGVSKDKLVKAVQDGLLEEEYVDTAVRNVLCLVDWYLEHRDQGAELDPDKDHDFAGKAAVECAVLLKNEKGVLPLSKTAKVAFIGEFAKKPRYQGSGSSFINSYKVVSALDATGDKYVSYAQGYHANDDKTDEALLFEAVEAAKAAEAAVVFAGLPDASESEGFDRSTLDMPENQNELIKAIAAVNPNVVVVLHNGAPVLMPWIDQVAAVLELYLGGENVGTATAALLYGDVNPSGKLAETFPKKLSDTPSYFNFPGENGQVDYREGIYVGYRYYDKKEMDVAFPFGHGLSYTMYEYSELKIDKKQMADNDCMTVSCKVKNTGSLAGKEVVQLYVRDMESSVGRPIREMKDFVKIYLKPGEEKTLIFTLDKKSFAYYEPRLKDWFVETGSFMIEIGASSRDIRLSEQVQVQGTVEIPMIFSRHSAVGDILKTTKGQNVLGGMLKNYGSDRAKAESQGNSLGEGSQAMMQAMMAQMPLSVLGTFGGISDEEIDGIVAMLNS